MILFLAVTILLPDLYIIKSFLKGYPVWTRILQWVPTILLLLSIVATMTGIIDREFSMTVFFALFLMIILPKFLFMIVSIIGRIIHLKAAANILGVSLGVILCLCCLYGMTYGWKRVVKTEVELSFKDLPESFDGYKIVQLSDWHLGTYSKSVETIKKEVDLVNSLNPDMIVFTGDIVNGDPEELEPFKSILSSLNAADGVYSVMGNHDYCMYGSAQSNEGRARNISTIQQDEKDFGWRLLLNENALIRRGTDSLAIVGVENDGNPPFPQRGDLDKAQQGLDKDAFKVLLSHDPTHWKRTVLPNTNIQLTLSGHTHAMQFRIGRLSPSRLAYSEWGGLYQEGDRKLYVSTGSGGNIAFRFGAWPEVVEITLRKE